MPQFNSYINHAERYQKPLWSWKEIALIPSVNHNNFLDKYLILVWFNSLENMKKSLVNRAKIARNSSSIDCNFFGKRYFSVLISNFALTKIKRILVKSRAGVERKIPLNSSDFGVLIIGLLIRIKSKSLANTYFGGDLSIWLITVWHEKLFHCTYSDTLTMILYKNSE